MDRIADTSIARPVRLKGGHLDACLIHIYPVGPTMGRRYPLGTDTLLMGRAESCEIRIQDGSVSRRHAKIEPTSDGFSVLDLGSTNGTFVNDRQTKGIRQLRDGDYLRIGNGIYRFLTGGNIEAEYHEEIYRLTIIDGLTQIHNQRYLLDFLDRELARSRRHRRPLAVLMLDIDKFKAVNDEHGHLCGDYVLRELSHRLKPAVRREDLFARYGGEEFCLVLVETPLKSAVEVAERTRVAVDAKPFEFETNALSVTVSVGVATTDGARDMSAAELLKLADEKLYAAKRAGRNRVMA
ncbi:MAG: diguanylate cyclase [Fimbriiglobus sp.]